MISHVSEQVVPSGPAAPAAANQCMVAKAVEDAVAERALKVLGREGGLSYLWLWG